MTVLIRALCVRIPDATRRVNGVPRHCNRKGVPLGEWGDVDIAYRNVGPMRSDQNGAAAEYAIGL
jgi:hypothetical protein